MTYNHAWLAEELEKNDLLKFVFFWGHRPKKDGTVGAFCLSQWYERGFIEEGVTYPTAEHWMMAEKARLFEDTEILEQILVATHPDQAKKLGRQVKDFDPNIWEQNRMDIVIKGNLLKFSQHEDLKKYLLETSNKILVEASPFDKIWGIGMRKNEEGILHPDNWKGLNLLGYALMEVRHQLQ